MVGNRVGRTLHVSLPTDCDAEVLAGLGDDIAREVHAHRDDSVVLDVGAIEIIDPVDAEALTRVCRVISMLGSKAVVAGLRPEVVTSLIATGSDLAGVECVLDVGDWVERLQQGRAG